MSLIDLGVDSVESREVYESIRYYAKRSGVRDWEDVAQEAYIKLWKYGLDSSKSKFALIRTSVRNLAIDLTYRYRSKLIGLTNTIGDNSNFQASKQQYYDDYAATVFNNFLDKLSQLERDVAVTTIRMTYSQAADVLDMPVGTLKSCTNRIKIKARRYADSVRL